MKTLIIALLISSFFCTNVKAAKLLTDEDKVDAVMAMSLDQSRAERAEFEEKIIQDSLSALSRKNLMSYEVRTLIKDLRTVSPNKNDMELLATLASVLMAKRLH